MKVKVIQDDKNKYIAVLDTGDYFLEEEGKTEVTALKNLCVLLGGMLKDMKDEKKQIKTVIKKYFEHSGF